MEYLLFGKWTLGWRRKGDWDYGGLEMVTSEKEFGEEHKKRGEWGKDPFPPSEQKGI